MRYEAIGALPSHRRDVPLRGGSDALPAGGRRRAPRPPALEELAAPTLALALAMGTAHRHAFPQPRSSDTRKLQDPGFGRAIAHLARNIPVPTSPTGSTAEPATRWRLLHGRRRRLCSLPSEPGPAHAPAISLQTPSPFRRRPRSGRPRRARGSRRGHLSPM